jgi:hypothetical protein
VVGLAFMPVTKGEEILVTASWDKTARLHQMFSKTLST